jgi:hypothetical protein
MSNKSQLQTNNALIASLLEVLKLKAAGDGGGQSEGPQETVTEEVNTYTTTLAALEVALTSIEKAIVNKAAWPSFPICNVHISSSDGLFGDDSSGTLLYTTVGDDGKLVSMRVDGKTSDICIPCVIGSLLVVNETGARISHDVSGLEELPGPYNFFGPTFGVFAFKVTGSLEGSEAASLQIYMVEGGGI